MQFHLVLPGLVWPSPDARGLAAGLDLPALDTLLTHARLRSTPALGPEEWLGQAFGLIPGAVPHALLRRLGEDSLPPPPAGSHWLAADPVHLHFAREHLLLADASSHRIDAAEAQQLVATLNDNFADIGHFEMASPERWYLRLEQAPDAHFTALGEVLGRPIPEYLPGGAEGRSWQRLLNEAQILLYNHPVNQQREAEGRPTANSLWLWGAGELPAAPVAPAPCLYGSDLLLGGLARAAGNHIAPLDLARPGDADGFAFDASLLSPARYLDLGAWRDALLALEQGCFAPALAALRQRRISRLRISAPGDRATLELEVGAGDLWRFWHRQRGLDAVLERLP